MNPNRKDSHGIPDDDLCGLVVLSPPYRTHTPLAMKALETLYRWAHTPWDALTRVVVAIAMVLPISSLSMRAGCWLLAAALSVQFVFAGLVFLATAKHK